MQTLPKAKAQHALSEDTIYLQETKQSSELNFYTLLGLPAGFKMLASI